MRASKRWFFLSSWSLLPLLPACLAGPAALASEGREIESLRAFTKLYGYVRFFHPSDEASLVDWDKLAVHGAARVKQAGSSEELERTLAELFSPVAPALVLYPTGEEPPGPAGGSEAGSDAVPVAWQHRGVGLTGRGPYVSARTHREHPAMGLGFGTVTQWVPAAPYQGQEIRLRAAVRAEVSGAGNQGQLWLRVDRPQRQPGFFDNMQDRPITGAEWQVVEIVGEVAEDAEKIFFGGFLAGEGKAYFDAFELAVRDHDGAWQPIELPNPSFEASSEELAEWGGGGEGYDFTVAAGGAYDGRHSALIVNQVEGSKLFAAVPAAGEVVDKELGAGLSCRLPLALEIGPEAAAEAPDGSPLKELLGRLDAIDLAADGPARRLGAVVIAWNVFQHFYPYFDVVPADWDGELTRALRGALAAADQWTFYLVLKRLVAGLHDGHGQAFHAGLNAGRGYFPLRVDWVEEQVVVTASQVPEIERGDVVVEVDGVAAVEVLRQVEEILSGSPQWKRYRSLAAFGWGEKGTAARLAVRRQGEELEVEVTRGELGSVQEPAAHEKIAELAGGVYYVDLSRASMEEITKKTEALAAAPGVVFDLRGYPKGNHEVIRHLIDEPVRSAKWMVPQIIYPDREKVAGYDTSGRWTLEPAEPRFRGRIVFLTDGRAISYAESVMGIIEHYELGEIVGQPTAGTNGNVNVFNLPGGYRVSWTGMKVVKHDDSQHHLVGIRPTVPLARTLLGIREGRDEHVEKAIEIIESAREPAPQDG